MLLEIKDITVHYGKSMAIEGVSLDVREGTIVSIIGANGAGKSTILRGLVIVLLLSTLSWLFVYNVLFLQNVTSMV